jgi:tetratricopeptide (TPR) repeat protein
MKHVECSQCQKTTIPMNESIKVDGLIFCNDCAEKQFADRSLLEGKLLENDIDPTVCAFCSEDKGDIDLPKTSKYPICDDCAVDLKKRVMPDWVKAFFAAVVVIVIGSFIWNWKYYQAYNDIKKANAFFAAGNASEAANLMASASEKVTEVNDLKIATAYFKGWDFMSKDKSAEALVEFNKCKTEMPFDTNLKLLINQAEIGVAFDNKNYDDFLKLSQEVLKSDSTSATLWTSVASAYACVYVDKGLESAKIEAIKHLDKAKSIDNTSDEMKQYYNRVEYRLDARKIIKSEDFIKQFPNGWTKN